jgi:hypothetical protein
LYDLKKKKNLLRFYSYIFFLLDLFLIMFQPIITLPKRGRKCQVDNTQLGIMEDNTLNLACREQVNFSATAGTQKNVRQNISVGHRKKQAVCSESVGLRECSSIKHQHGASIKSERVLEKEQLSSCDSVTRLSLAESHVSAQILERNGPSSKGNVSASSKIIAEPSEYSRAKLKDACSLNVSMN